LAIAVAGSRRRLDLLWVVLARGGILALTRGGVHGLGGRRLAYALAAGCLWAAYSLLNARLGRAFEGSTGLTLAMCIGAVAVLPVGIAAAGSHLLEPASLALRGAAR